MKRLNLKNLILGFALCSFACDFCNAKGGSANDDIVSANVRLQGRITSFIGKTNGLHKSYEEYISAINEYIKDIKIKENKQLAKKIANAIKNIDKQLRTITGKCDVLAGKNDKANSKKVKTLAATLTKFNKLFSDRDVSNLSNNPSILEELDEASAIIKIEMLLRSTITVMKKMKHVYETAKETNNIIGIGGQTQDKCANVIKVLDDIINNLNELYKKLYNKEPSNNLYNKELNKEEYNNASNENTKPRPSNNMSSASNNKDTTVSQNKTEVVNNKTQSNVSSDPFANYGTKKRDPFANINKKDPFAASR